MALKKYRSTNILTLFGESPIKSPCTAVFCLAFAAGCTARTLLSLSATMRVLLLAAGPFRPAAAYL